jgi:hypothetical protein
MREVYLDRIDKMMTYLGLTKYSIPWYKLAASDLPFNHDNRSNKEYILFKDGSLTYKAVGSKNSNNPISDIERKYLVPSDDFLKEAVNVLVDLCKDKALRTAQGSEILNLHRLILKFRGLDFVKVSEFDLNKFEYGSSF